MNNNLFLTLSKPVLSENPSWDKQNRGSYYYPSTQAYYGPYSSLSDAVEQINRSFLDNGESWVPTGFRFAVINTKDGKTVVREYIVTDTNGVATVDKCLMISDSSKEIDNRAVAFHNLTVDVQAALNKANTALQEHLSLDGYATEVFVQSKVDSILGGVSGKYNNLKKISDRIIEHDSIIEGFNYIGKRGNVNSSEIFNDYGNNKAYGIYSHAEGYNTITNNIAEHAEGKFNLSNPNTIHSVGVGISNSNRKNAHEILTDGRNYILNVGNYDGTNLDEAKDLASTILEIEAIAKGRSKGFVFDTLEAMFYWLDNQENRKLLNLGDNLYIKALDVPDYWWDGESALMLETQKVDLSGYLTYDVFESYRLNVSREITNINTTIYGINSHIGQLSDDISEKYTKPEGGIPASDLAETYITEGNAVGKSVGNNGEIFNNYTGNQATGPYAHAEGSNSIASGYYSHAEGCGTRASGPMSHAEGFCTITYGVNQTAGEHAEGMYNVSSLGTVHSVGIGTSEEDRKNAHLIFRNGKHYIYGIGSYDGTNAGEENVSDLATVLETYATTQTMLNRAVDTVHLIATDAYYLANSAHSGISALNNGFHSLGQQLNTKYYKPETGIPASDLEETYLPVIQVGINETLNIDEIWKSVVYNNVNIPQLDNKNYTLMCSIPSIIFDGVDVWSWSVNLIAISPDNEIYIRTNKGSSPPNLNAPLDEKVYGEWKKVGDIGKGDLKTINDLSIVGEGDITTIGRSGTVTGSEIFNDYNGNKASGYYSHAEGSACIASAPHSHAEGRSTKAAHNYGEHSEGSYNVSNTNTIHSVGIGKNSVNRKNAHEIMTDGRHFIYGIGGYNGTNPDESNDLATVIKCISIDLNNAVEDIGSKADYALDLVVGIPELREQLNQVHQAILNSITAEADKENGNINFSWVDESLDISHDRNNGTLTFYNN